MSTPRIGRLDPATAYQERHRGAGLCTHCPRTALRKVIYDPETGVAYDERTLVWCGLHWSQDRDRRRAQQWAKQGWRPTP